MRGKLGVDLVDHDGLRNIPAYAGKTASVYSSEVVKEEHPRVCGENGNQPHAHKV